MTTPYLYLDTSILVNRVQSKFNNRMTNSVGPDKTASYKLPHLDLHCLKKYLCCSAGLKGFNQ